MSDNASQAPEKMSEAQRNIEEFWPEVTREMQQIKHVEPGNQLLPLARIKKIMKLDEDVKMISAEAPLLFAKAAEMFIQELTLRAWLHTEDNKRRTLQRSDIAMAIAKYDMFDFLIDIVPRDEIKPLRRDCETKSSTDDVQYYLQLAQQHQQALQSSSSTTGGGVSVNSNCVESSSSNSGNGTNAGNIVQLQATPGVTQQITVAASPQQPQLQGQSMHQQTPQIATIASAAPNIILTSPATGTTTMQPAGATVINPAQLTQGQPIQLVQQMITPTGEVTHIPIPLNQNQLNFIRSQIQLSGTSGATAVPNHQPIIIQAPQLQAITTIIQPNQAGGLINAAQLQQLQQQQQQQHPHAHIIQQSPVHHHHHLHHQTHQQQQPHE
ncbi:nuclear transcription factor Y subunit gamma-like isoform X2 [Toxorhynchites rutilus septentrionalis]|uniref:nuclear transcription factor Y subunit gamma-like isoform X2 n=1 Tax=Toxorhynchites rutilus septentrionalis TaxID=329112 RepID=UPI002479BE18|nr:nuclear transcription factor Y subunit gamma-like isoform X2 [Toxorhynchites rutilus septentrionalis]